MWHVKEHLVKLIPVLPQRFDLAHLCDTCLRPRESSKRKTHARLAWTQRDQKKKTTMDWDPRLHTEKTATHNGKVRIVVRNFARARPSSASTIADAVAPVHGLVYGVLSRRVPMHRKIGTSFLAPKDCDSDEDSDRPPGTFRETFPYSAAQTIVDVLICASRAHFARGLCAERELLSLVLRRTSVCESATALLSCGVIFFSMTLCRTPAATHRNLVIENSSG